MIKVWDTRKKWHFLDTIKKKLRIRHLNEILYRTKILLTRINAIQLENFEKTKTDILTDIAACELITELAESICSWHSTSSQTAADYETTLQYEDIKNALNDIIQHLKCINNENIVAYVEKIKSIISLFSLKDHWPQLPTNRPELGITSTQNDINILIRMFKKEHAQIIAKKNILTLTVHILWKNTKTKIVKKLTKYIEQWKIEKYILE